MAPKSNKNDKCHDCGKGVITNEKALSCSICENWYHIKGQKVPILDYDFLFKSDDSIQWTQPEMIGDLLICIFKMAAQ